MSHTGSGGSTGQVLFHWGGTQDITGSTGQVFFHWGGTPDITCGRHGLRWFFQHLNSSYHYHLCDHPRSLHCKAYGAEYSYLKVALSRFNFLFSFSYPSPLPPGVGWVLASSCAFGSHAHLLSGCSDSPSFHIPLKAPHFSTHDGSSPPLTAHENRESDTYPSNNYRSLCMKYLWSP